MKKHTNHYLLEIDEILVLILTVITLSKYREYVYILVTIILI